MHQGKTGKKNKVNMSKSSSKGGEPEYEKQFGGTLRAKTNVNPSLMGSM
jgi:hypothetical protein